MVFPASLAAWAADQLRNTIRDTFDGYSTGAPQWIKNGTPESLIQRLNQSAARQTCRRWARNVDNLPADRNAAYANLCQPYLQDIGEFPGNPDIEAGFSGGQCPIEYYVVVTYDIYLVSNGSFFTSITADSQAAGNIKVLGPIGSAFYGTGSAVHPCGGDQGAGCQAALGSYVWSCNSSPNTFEFRNVRIASVRPVNSGQADSCGDPPVEYEEPPPITTPLPPTRFNPSVDVDFNFDVDILPDGKINIEFDTDVQVPVEVEVDPFGGGGAGGGGSPPVPPGDRGDPGGEFDTEDGPPEGEAPPGKILTGVLVDAISIANFVNKTEVPGGVVYRGVCYVLMGGEAGVDLQPEGSTVIFPQFFEAPENSTKWKVYANNGYRLSVIPFYRDIPEE